MTIRLDFIYVGLISLGLYLGFSHLGNPETAWAWFLTASVSLVTLLKDRAMSKMFKALSDEIKKLKSEGK